MAGILLAMATKNAGIKRGVKKSAKNWGFDTRELSKKIRPQDDFYHFVADTWQKQNPIPKSESWWGSFMMLRHKVDKQLRDLFKDIELKRKSPVQSPERLIRDFYRSGMDMKRRNELGLTPLKRHLARIEAIDSYEDAQEVIAKLHRLGVGVFWGSGVDQDAKRAERYALYLGQGGLGLPDRDYYLKGDAESKRVRGAYKVHVARLFKLMGYSSADAERMRDSNLAIETKLAQASMTKEDRRDPDKTYHKMTVAQLRKRAPHIDWRAYLKRIDADSVSYVIVMQPKFFDFLNRTLPRLPLPELKAYLAWHLVSDFSGALSDPFIRESFSFYGKVMSGTQQLRPLWRRVLGAVNGGLGELVGQLYVERYFPKEAKTRMMHLVADLFTAYEARLRSLDWMSAATKKKALKKLHALNPKIGYPDKWKSYKGLKIVEDDYVGNIIRVSEFEHKRETRKLGRPIDRTEWFMYPQTVNAYFAPPLNDIVFPAAILQPPFFGLNHDDAINYGCIGAVIGHEITHGFDDEGSKFDAKGNLKSWWTPADRKRFEAKAKKVEEQYDRYSVADGVKVNGKLTLGENIADMGGISIAYDAYQIQLARTGRTDIEGLTPEQRFFLGVSIFDREHSRPEAQKMRVLTDPHSPGIFRVNGPLANFEAFYEAWGVKKGDKMYRPPAAREMVW